MEICILLHFALFVIETTKAFLGIVDQHAPFFLSLFLLPLLICSLAVHGDMHFALFVIETMKVFLGIVEQQAPFFLSLFLLRSLAVSVHTYMY